MAEPGAESRGDNPLRTFQDHVLPLLAGLGGLVTVLVSLGYEAFYSPLGVRPAEIGLGARDVVIHAALGFVLVLALNGLMIGTAVLVAVGWRLTWGSRRSSRAGTRVAAAADTGSPSRGPSWRQRLVAVGVLLGIWGLLAIAFLVPGASTVVVGALALSALLGGVFRALWSSQEHDTIAALLVTRLTAVSIGFLAGFTWSLRVSPSSSCSLAARTTDGSSWRHSRVCC